MSRKQQKDFTESLVTGPFAEGPLLCPRSPTGHCTPALLFWPHPPSPLRDLLDFLSSRPLRPGAGRPWMLLSEAGPRITDHHTWEVRSGCFQVRGFVVKP